MSTSKLLEITQTDERISKNPAHKQLMRTLTRSWPKTTTKTYHLPPKNWLGENQHTSNLTQQHPQLRQGDTLLLGIEIVGLEHAQMPQGRLKVLLIIVSKQLQKVRMHAFVNDQRRIEGGDLNNNTI
jgi:hypothetical protein